jgi:hypothetical protein
MKNNHIQYCILNYEQLYITKTNKIILFSYYKNYFFGECNTNLYIDLSAQSIFSTINKTPLFFKNLNKFLQSYTFNSTTFYYKKIRFKGKGYKIKKTKKKKSFKLYFGHSHKNYIFSGGLILKKLSKYRLLLLTNNKKCLNKVTKLITNIKIINRYTKRGLRCTKQFILKRPGKKSTY